MTIKTHRELAIRSNARNAGLIGLANIRFPFFLDMNQFFQRWPGRCVCTVHAFVLTAMRACLPLLRLGDDWKACPCFTQQMAEHHVWARFHSAIQTPSAVLLQDGKLDFPNPKCSSELCEEGGVPAPPQQAHGNSQLWLRLRQGRW